MTAEKQVGQVIADDGEPGFPQVGGFFAVRIVDSFKLLGLNGIIPHTGFKRFGLDDETGEQFLAHPCPDASGKNGILRKSERHIKQLFGSVLREIHTGNIF